MREVIDGLKSKIDALTLHTKVLKKDLKFKDQTIKRLKEKQIDQTSKAVTRVTTERQVKKAEQTLRMAGIRDQSLAKKLGEVFSKKQLRESEKEEEEGLRNFMKQDIDQSEEYLSLIA